MMYLPHGRATTATTRITKFFMFKVENGFFSCERERCGSRLLSKASFSYQVLIGRFWSGDEFKMSILRTRVGVISLVSPLFKLMRPYDGDGAPGNSDNSKLLAFGVCERSKSGPVQLYFLMVVGSSPLVWFLSSVLRRCSPARWSFSAPEFFITGGVVENEKISDNGITSRR